MDRWILPEAQDDKSSSSPESDCIGISIIETTADFQASGDRGYRRVRLGPVCAAAVLAGKPIILQEHNSYPGVMTRMFAPFAREVHLAFESSKKYFRKQTNLHLTGSPIRRMEKVNREEALRFFGLNPNLNTLLVTGGSLGAVKLNSAVLEAVDDLADRNYQLIWQTGSSDFERIKSLSSKNSDRIWVGKFIEKMGLAYSAADFVVCRAGATTVAELIYFGLPSLLVPYPYAAANHQVENARALVETGAAAMVVESETEERFRQTLLSFADSPDRLTTMREKTKMLHHGDAAGVVADSIEKISSEEIARRNSNA